MYEIDLKTLRTDMGVSQKAMALAMGLPLRTYEDIEAGRSALRPVHRAAACFAAMDMAEKAGTPEKLPGFLRGLVESLHGQTELNKKPAS